MGYVTLSAPAPAGGAAVLLSSSNPAVVCVPTSVVVPAGRDMACFMASTRSVKATTTVSVTATLGDSRKSCDVKVITFKYWPF